MAPRPPGPRTLHPAGHLFPFSRDPLGFLTKLAREHGDVARFRAGPREVWLLSGLDDVHHVLVAEPGSFRKAPGLQMARALLGDGLLTSEGELHRRQRRLATPAFRKERIAAYVPVMVRRALDAQERWRDGEVIDAARETSRVALRVAAEALFGADVERDIETVEEALTEAVEQFRMARVPVHRLLERLPLPSTLRFRRARAALDAVVLRFVRARRAGSGGGSDLLSHLLEARDPEGGPAMDDAQLRDEAMTLFLAGHETTANALAWTLHLLAIHPGEQERLHAELDAVLGGRPPASEDLPRLGAAERAFAEGMRLYPPAWTIARTALRPFRTSTGHEVPAGATVMMSQWVVHRDARWHPEPDHFDPGRFLPERRAAMPRLAYFPFGAGPRLCIGEGFAWAEGTLVLAALLARWRARPGGPPPEPRARITLRPAGGVWLVVERRGS